MEYRLLNTAGGFRWHLVRATPMHNSDGAIVKWFGACADIDDQIRNQQVLEEQIRQHPAALMEANTLFQSEMRRAHPGAAGIEPAKRAHGTGTDQAFESRHQPGQDGGTATELLRSQRRILNAFGPQDCWALRTGHMHVVLTGDHSAESVHAVHAGHSYLCVPLLAHGEAIGILHFQNIESGEVPQPVLLMVNMFAEQVGLSIANIRLREALRNQSIRDPLTRLYNRRYLEEMLERETRRAVRSEQGLGSSCSIWITSRNSTTPTDTMPATPFCARLLRPC